MFEGQRLSVARVEPGIALMRMINNAGGFLDDASETELACALDLIDAATDLRAVVITGAAAGVFVRHYDVQVLEERGRQLAARGLRFSLERKVPESAYLRCLRRITESRLPFVAAINGVAMGGGFELALACDLRIAQAGDYPIGLPEVNIGLLPGAGGTQRLTRLVGQAVAMRSLLLGRTWRPEQAAAQGLVDECVQGEALERALGLARELRALPALAVGHIKQLVRAAASQGLSEGMAAERTLFCDLMVSDESIARMHEMNIGQRKITG